jgi:hypothetical protein
LLLQTDVHDLAVEMRELTREHADGLLVDQVPDGGTHGWNAVVRVGGSGESSLILRTDGHHLTVEIRQLSREHVEGILVEQVAERE